MSGALYLGGVMTVNELSYTQVPQIVYVTFLRRVDTNRIIGGGNRGPADKPCQNQTELLMGASFIYSIVQCIHPIW